jgi:uncharacterized protein YqcC (DUF446 family)
MSVSDQVIIKFSRLKIIWFTSMVLVVVGGIASLLQSGSIVKYVMSIISIVIGSILAYQEYWNLLELNKPQLVISTNGITTPDKVFYPWHTISNEKLVPLGSVKQTWFLWFETPGRNRKLHLDGLDKRPEQILALINAYRQAAGSLINEPPLTINDNNLDKTISDMKEQYTYRNAEERLLRIENELRNLGEWQVIPPDPALFDNMGAFGSNTMPFTTWLQFVLIPNVKNIISKRGKFPESSSVATYSYRNLDGEKYATLNNLLSDFDALFIKNSGR